MLTLCMHGVLFLTVFYFESVSAADDLCLFGGVRFSPFTDSVLIWPELSLSFRSLLSVSVLCWFLSLCTSFYTFVVATFVCVCVPF